MTDRISKEKRSWNMGQIHGKDTGIEKVVRSYLFSQGFRFRKNDKRYPGHPDIVLPKYRTVIFVNGCFWHRHKGCKLATTPKSNTDFWLTKFEKNVENDKLHGKQLHDLGWSVITIWECELKDHFEDTMSRVIALLSEHARP